MNQVHILWLFQHLLTTFPKNGKGHATLLTSIKSVYDISFYKKNAQVSCKNAYFTLKIDTLKINKKTAIFSLLKLYKVYVSNKDKYKLFTYNLEFSPSFHMSFTIRNQVCSVTNVSSIDPLQRPATLSYC